MSYSPYTPGSVPTKLPGRADKLTQFRNAARRIDVDAQFVPRVHVDHGPRGIGKTSLLREAQRIFASYHIRSVLITADPHEDLVQSLLSELKHVVGSGSRIRKAAIEAIDSASLSLGAPGIAGVTISAKRPDGGAATAKEFQRALRAALKAVAADGDAGIALLIDEIQEADASSLRTIAYAWREMSPLHLSDADQPPTALFAVGLPGAPTKINKAVTFSERFSFQPMNGLTDAGAREALELPAADAGVAWDREALDLAAEESAGYPYKVQLIGDFTWNAASDRLGGDGVEHGEVIRLEDVTEALKDVENEMRTLFASRWNASSEKQREFLIAVARLGGFDVKRAALATELGANTRSISVTRQRLLDKGLIDANKHGHLSFTVPGFTEFVLDQANNG